MKHELKTFRVVEARDLDNAVNDFLGLSRGDGYECVPTEEWNNYSYYLVDTSLSSYQIEWGYSLEEKRKAGQRSHFASVSYYLYLIAQAGLIPHGSYLVKVSW